MASTKIPLELTAYAPDADGATLELQTTDTTVTDGSVLGKIEFKAPKEASGTDAILVGAAIEAVAEGTFAADNNATELVFKTGASEAAAQKMVLTSAARLGINEASPDLTLHVNSGASNAVAKFESTDSIAVAQFKDNNGEAEIGCIGNDIGFYPAGAEKMRISGNNLHLNGGTDARIQLNSGGAGANSTSNDTVHIRGDGDDMKLMAAAAGNYIFEVNGSEKMRITSTGGLLVGTSTSQLYSTSTQSGIALHDTNSYASCGAHLEIACDSDTGWSPIYINKWDWNSGDDGRFIAMYINGGTDDSASLLYDGTNVAIANYSDYRLKENIVDYTGGLTTINALKVKSFNKKEGASKGITQQGFLAHELAEHIPLAVLGEKDAMKVDEMGKTVPDYQQVTRETFVPYLVSAIQELSAKNDALEARIKTLEES
mgnify:CR=1 FL=1